MNTIMNNVTDLEKISPWPSLSLFLSLSGLFCFGIFCITVFSFFLCLDFDFLTGAILHRLGGREDLRIAGGRERM